MCFVMVESDDLLAPNGNSRAGREEGLYKYLELCVIEFPISLELNSRLLCVRLQLLVWLLQYQYAEYSL